MFREILKALRASNKLSEMVAQIGQMLDAGKWMFAQASEALAKEADWERMAGGLYAKDKEVNALERAVREGIVTHLSTGHTADLSACLVLMSVVKDAERIGDYCKNIFEIAKFYRREYTHPEYARPLDEIRRAADPLFDKAKTAFVKADADLAYETQAQAEMLTKKCDLIIQQLLLVQAEIAADEAVAYVLLARFYKRVVAHLSNISTAAVAPLPMLDFHLKAPSGDE